MDKKILFFTVLLCSSSLTAYTEEYDENLIAKQVDISNKENKEDIVILKSNGNDDEVSVSLGEDDRVQDKDGYFKNEYTMSDKNLEEFRSFLKNNYDEKYSKKVRVDGGYIKKKRGAKFDIKVRDAKKTKLGSTRSDLQHAYDAFMKKQYELAIMHYRRALSKNKDSIEAKFGLAVSYHMLKQYDQAIELYTKMINKNFSRQKIVHNLFIALEHKTQDEALDILSSIDSRSPGYSDILGQIGVIYIKKHDNIKAISALSKANELSPSNALVSYNLGYVYDLEKNYDYAKHFYEQATRNGISDILSSDDYTRLVKRIAELDKIIKEEVEKIVKNNKKQ